MDHCLSEEPPLSAVAGDGDHRSSCWLPTSAAGVSDEAEELRRQTVAAGRTGAAAAVAEAIAESPEAEGSVIA